MSSINKPSQTLRLLSYCPACDMRSKSIHARTLAVQGETKLMHIQCHKCANAFLAYVLVNQVGASTVGILTDLGYEDVMRFRSSKDVSVNDVIDAHEYFAKGGFLVSVEKKRAVRSKATMKQARKQLGK